ncbi:unnamed protein product [Protopolystoma xenopodis]|uniref:Uncharacterized protein n=1 Tax=Protopolystoma xenopodis TaxID=117903 RepID=A0A3S5CLG4_9PLAT|nr:unnamed protein product [Protopolystoma xenopodis]
MLITRADGSRVYGLALLFPEPILHRGVQAAVVALQDMYEADLTSLGSAGGAAFLRPGDEFNPTSAGGARYQHGKDQLFSMKAIGLLLRHPFSHGLFGWLEDVWATIHLPATSSLPLLSSPAIFPEARSSGEKDAASSSSLPSTTPSPSSIGRLLEAYIYNLLFEIRLPPPSKCLAFWGPFREHYCYNPTSLSCMKCTSHRYELR